MRFRSQGLNSVFSEIRNFSNFGFFLIFVFLCFCDADDKIKLENHFRSQGPNYNIFFNFLVF